MIGDKIKYTCKSCGWTVSIREEWADLKPKRCMNKKCNTSFMKHPESLVAQVPEKPKAEAKLEAALKKTDELPAEMFGKEEAQASELPRTSGRKGRKNESQND